MRRGLTRRLSLTIAMTGLAAVATGTAIVLATGDDETPAPAAATETATVAPSPPPTFTPAPPTPPPAPPRLTEPRPFPEAVITGAAATVQPGAAVAADPVRVFTGDGDCLNVRPQPGTSFEAAPYSCIPEGTLLWLTGDTVEADGETWRYALGAGWIATRYVVTTDHTSVSLPGDRVTVWIPGAYREQLKDGAAIPLAGQDLHVARVNVATGEVERSVVFGGYGGGGIGGRNPEISPSGRFIAYSQWDPNTGQNRTVIGDIEAGSAMVVPGYPNRWSEDDRMITSIDGNCSDGCLWQIAVYAARSQVYTVIADEFSGYPVAWMEDGVSVLAVDQRDQFFRVGLNGEITPLAQLSVAAGYWDSELSPSGDILLSTGSLDATSLTNITTAAVERLPRAPQRELPGKCGGSWSRSIGWFDDETFFYHERSSSNGRDGITIANIRGETLAVFPFFNAQDIAAVGPRQLSFSSWSSTSSDTANLVTFVLDVETGDFVPVVAGAGAVWQ